MWVNVPSVALGQDPGQECHLDPSLKRRGRKVKRNNSPAGLHHATSPPQFPHQTLGVFTGALALARALARPPPRVALVEAEVR